MNKTAQNVNDYIPSGQMLKIGQPYRVQCTNYSCLAAVDKVGRWKAFSTGKSLPDVINVFVTV